MALCVGTGAEGPSIEDRIRGAMLGSLVADALSLGTHYEYDATKIKRFYGDIDRYYAPGERTGGETHGVGEQANRCVCLFVFDLRLSL